LSEYEEYRIGIYNPEEMDTRLEAVPEFYADWGRLNGYEALCISDAAVYLCVWIDR